ncbi:hypothetical protein G5I_01562 [Acromyrmex echinatior]|uniref:Uncharacterized protein n=1 Tax=Acromyrmex echinatior TaxID=103372 RepID=F4W7Y5_ACREC|nr:hypothetical protein G5I_01562 [Acromyrmex echinatior]
MEPGGCAQTSEPQLELEESTVHSIERNATSWRARVDSWRSRAALIFCSRRIYVDDELDFRVDGNCLGGNIRNMGTRRKVSAGHNVHGRGNEDEEKVVRGICGYFDFATTFRYTLGCSERDGCGLRATSEFRSTDVR